MFYFLVVLSYFRHSCSSALKLISGPRSWLSGLLCLSMLANVVLKATIVWISVRLYLQECESFSLSLVCQNLFFLFHLFGFRPFCFARSLFVVPTSSLFIVLMCQSCTLFHRPYLYSVILWHGNSPKVLWTFSHRLSFPLSFVTLSSSILFFFILPHPLFLKFGLCGINAQTYTRKS